MRPVSFWRRAATTPDDVAARTPDGEPLATYGDVARLSRSLVTHVSPTPAPSVRDESAAGLLAVALVEGIRGPHRDALAAAGTTDVLRELYLDSWGSLVAATAERSGVVADSSNNNSTFLVPGGLHHASLRVVASWALHAGYTIVLCDGSDPTTVGGALAVSQPDAAFLTLGVVRTLLAAPTTAATLSRVGTVLVPTTGDDQRSNVETWPPNLQPIVFPAAVPTNAVRRAPARYGMRSFWDWADVQPDRVAIHDHATGARVSFGELRRRATEISDRIAALGWRPSPMLISAAPDTISKTATVLAAQAGGFRWMAAPTVPDLEAFARRFGDEIDVIDGGSIWLVRPSPSGPFAGAMESAGGLISGTSGSTGNGRGIFHRLPSTDPAEVGAMEAQLGALLGMPLGGSFGLAGSLLNGSFLTFAMAALHGGNEIHAFGPGREADIAEAIARHQLSSVFLLPRMLKAVLAAYEAGDWPHPARDDDSPLRAVVHGGERLDPATKRRAIDVFGPIVHEVYSTTEGNGTYILCDDWLRRPGSVGWPLLGALLRFGAGDDTDDADADDIYLWTDEAVFIDGSDTLSGWFRTGDQGYLDDAGALYLTGRDPELLRCNGAKLAGRQIATALEEEPGVVEAAAIVVPSAGPAGDGGQRDQLVAYVAGSSDGGGIDVDALRAELAKKLNAALVPERLIVIDALPRLAGGKVDWQSLQRMATGAAAMVGAQR